MNLEDIQSLNDHRYITDEPIKFMLEHFLSTFEEDIAQAICIISPSVVFLVRMHYDEHTITQLLEELELGRKELIIMPINDHNSVDSEGGNHWSLLVFLKCKNAFYHFDSLKHCNMRHAQKVAKIICKVLPGATLDNSEVQFRLPFFYPADCDSQKNNYDCGLYLINYAKRVMELFQSRTYKFNNINLNGFYQRNRVKETILAKYPNLRRINT